MNKFPSDDLEDYDALRKGLADVQALLANRAPLTEASQGWILRSASGPNPSELGPSDVWIGAQGGQLVAMDSSGGTIALAPPPAFPIAPFAAVSDVSLPSASGTYDASDLQAVIDAVELLAAQVIGLRDDLVTGDLMLPG